MKTKGYDLRLLIMKSDLEFALLEMYQTECEILSEKERSFFSKYQDDSLDILDCIRQVLLDFDNKMDSCSLFGTLQREIIKLYPEDKELHDQVSELRGSFVLAIEQGEKESKNIFLSNARILK